MTPFAELAVTTNFSFLRGGSHPEELVAEAARLGLAGIAVADRNTLAGIVRGHSAAKAASYPYAVGCRLAFRDGTPDILAWPTDRAAYGRLCRLLTLGNRRAEKGDCQLDLDDLLAWGEGMVLGLMPGRSGSSPPADSARASFEAPLPGAPQDEAGRDLHEGEPDRPAHGTHPPAHGAHPPPHGEVLREAEPRTTRRRSPEAGGTLASVLAQLHDAFPGSVRLMANRLYGPGDHRRLALLDRLARRIGVPLLATNDVLYHAPERRPLQDVITCVREHRTLTTAGLLLAPNAERHLKDAAEMARLFCDYPEALAEPRAVFERLAFSLDELRYQYPDEPTGDAASPQEALIRLTEEGARFRYPDGVPEKIRKTLRHELALIENRNYAPYFLTVHDIVRYARAKGILCQGRGSAANSAVCFCLGITEVNPDTTELLFERFISPERNEPPDIDVDFEHERREEVMQYIYAKYGRERTGIAATVITYRTRSAVREVGKAFGLSEDTVNTLSGTIWGWSSAGVREADIRRVGLDPTERTMQQVVALSGELIGFPRHLSQHVGGFVMTKDRLDEMVPIMNAAMEDRTNIEWDKDDLDAVGMLKVDVLALGMLSCIRRAFDFMKEHYGGAPTLASIHDEDPAVYRMLQRADSLGVFQVESRAQMTMLPRLKPKNFYDLVIEVAIVRPGPIQGDMVHPYLRRRQGIEKVEYPAPSPEHGPADELERVLGRTLGVPLFQEQAMKIAMEAAKFTAAEADKLRRAMATFKRVGTIKTFQDKMVEGMVRRGYQRDFAERCFHQIEGFGEYGFPESHAASFALLVYASAWLKCHYPDVFCAALLNAQPMGFYAPAQIVRDAERHGIAVHAPDVNFSGWDSALEEEAGEEAPPLPSPPPERGRLGGGPTHAGVGGDHSESPSFPMTPSLTLPLSGGGDAPLPAHSVPPFGDEQPGSGEDSGDIRSPPPPSPPPERGRLGGGPTHAGGATARRFDHSPAKTERARRLRREATSAERILWSKLRSAQIEGASFRRQHPVGPYVLDFCCPSLHLVVELDGDQHGHARQEAADRRRDAWLIGRGVTVLRFWNTEVRENLSGVVEQIRLAVLAARAVTPSLTGAGTPSLTLPLSGGGDAPLPAPISAVNNSIRNLIAPPSGEGGAPTPGSPPPERGRLGGGPTHASAGDASPEEGRGVAPALGSPPPERGRLGGGQNAASGGEQRRLHPTNADMRCDIRSTHAVRLGLRQIKGFREEDADALAAARGRGYDSVRDLWLRSGLTRAAIERLADADAFRSLGLDRRDALWAARELGGGKVTDRLPLFDTADLADIRREPDVALPPMPIGEHVVNDYRYLSLSLKAHPLSFLRERLRAKGVIADGALRETPNGRRVIVSGLVLVRQRPGTASGVIFMTIEDETDIANIVVWPKIFEKFRPVVLGARLVAVTGKVQSESGVIHVIADRLEDFTPMLAALSEDAGDLESLARADEVRRPSVDMREKIAPRSRLVALAREEPTVATDLADLSAARVMPKGRNFH